MNKSKAKTTYVYSWVRLMTPGKACILLQSYISQVNRLKANKYKRKNEKTYDLTQVSLMKKYTLRLLTSIGVFNVRGSEKAILLGNEAYDLEREVRDWEFDVELQRDALNDKN